MKFPPHKCAMYLEHNNHKNSYEEIGQWIVDNDWYDWKNDESKQRAIDTNEIWTLQWHPNTPFRFFALASPTLEELLEWANEK